MGVVLAATALAAGLVWYFQRDSRAEPAEKELAAIFVVDAERKFPDVSPEFGILPGEFERHEALLVGWPVAAPRNASATSLEFHNDANQTLLNLIANAPPSLQVVVIVPSSELRQSVATMLEDAGISGDRVEVLVSEIDSPWVRDFAPFSMRHEQSAWLGTRFFRIPGQRDRDAHMARRLSAQSRMKMVDVPMYLDGGNVLSNGEGLIITTTQTLDLNSRFSYKRDDISRMLRQFFGARQVVYLEPLVDEGNQHVDMFLTMPDPDTVVLAEYTREQDPINHEVLERNVQRLSELKRDRGPLKIVRVPMPPRGGPIFGGTYTNVVYANGVLFVPRFGDVDPAGHARAVEIYQSLLPGWKIVSVEASAWLVLDGSIHCLTKNMFRWPAKRSQRPPA